MPKIEKEGKPLLTKNMREYQRIYSQRYYKKHIESERKRQRDYYHNVIKPKRRKEKYHIPIDELPPSKRKVKKDEKINCLKHKNGIFKITFD